MTRQADENVSYEWEGEDSVGAVYGFPSEEVARDWCKRGRTIRRRKVTRGPWETIVEQWPGRPSPDHGEQQ